MPAPGTRSAELAQRYRREGYWRGETFGKMLRERAQITPDRTAVIAAAGEPRWSYRELDERADALAAGFRDVLGLSPGDRVVVQLPNVPEFLSIVFGIFRAGMLPVFALPAHRLSEVAHCARASEAAAYVIPDVHQGFDYRDLARQVLGQIPSPVRVVVVGDPGPYTDIRRLETATLRNANDLPTPSPDDVALLQLSGGSTGLPKLIPRTHDDYIYMMRESAAICGLGPASVYVGTLPIAHNFAMGAPGIFGALYAGSTVALSLTPSPDEAFAIIEREHVAVTGVVPPVALIWAEAIATTVCNISSLQVLQVGGAKLTPEMARRIRGTLMKNGCAATKIQQVFGMAEGLLCYTRLDDPDDVVDTTQGRPVSPADELLVVDDHDCPLPAGAEGHLLTRGPYTIRTYYNQVDGGKAFTADGWYRTGDIISLVTSGAEDGRHPNVVVRGRADDRINRGGEKVSPDEVENYLLAHPDVHDAVVVAVADPYFGKRACAFVVPSSPHLRPADLKAWIRGRGLATFKVPDQIRLIDVFPTTGLGKISRRELRTALRQTL